VNREAMRPGIDRVFDEFLDDGRGTLDHFTGRDLVREVSREPIDRAQAQSPTLTASAACAAASLATGTR
jgi:hypothetical protein